MPREKLLYGIWIPLHEDLMPWVRTGFCSCNVWLWADFYKPFYSPAVDFVNSVMNLWIV